MAFPIYNEDDYKDAGRAGKAALTVLRSAIHEMQSFELLLLELLKRNSDLYESDEQQADSEALVPLLYETRESRLPELDAKLGELVAARQSLSATLDPVIGDWEPEAK